MSFGTNLQYLRQLSGNMTQESLAEKMSVSRQTISKWEMDREFVREYRAGEYTQFGVNAIYRRR